MRPNDLLKFLLLVYVQQAIPCISRGIDVTTIETEIQQCPVQAARDWYEEFFSKRV